MQPGYPHRVTGKPEELQRIAFADAAAWEAWLEANHLESQGIGVLIAKKGSGVESIRYPEVLDTAICFGWIDGRRERLDEIRFLQRFGPRRPRSRWSRINREKAAGADRCGPDAPGRAWPRSNGRGRTDAGMRPMRARPPRPFPRTSSASSTLARRRQPSSPA